MERVGGGFGGGKSNVCGQWSQQLHSVQHTTLDISHIIHIFTHDYDQVLLCRYFKVKNYNSHNAMYRMERVYSVQCLL